jgi:hypothetical protein
VWDALSPGEVAICAGRLAGQLDASSRRSSVMALERSMSSSGLWPDDDDDRTLCYTDFYIKRDIHHHQPINVPTAGALAFLTYYT